MLHAVPQTASEWNAETDVSLLAKAYRGRPWFPKLRLFAVACCRRIFDVFPDGPCRTAIEIGEQFANGRATKHDLHGAENDVRAAVNSAIVWTGKNSYIDKEPERSIAQAALACTLPAEHPAIDAPYRVQCIVGWMRYDKAIQDGLNEKEARVLSQQVLQIEANEQTSMLREMVGNPFLPPTHSNEHA